MECVCCKSPVSEKTGWRLKDDAWLCGACARGFSEWYRQRMARQNHCKKGETESFNEAAAKSIYGFAAGKKDQ